MNGHDPETTGASDWTERMRQGMPSSHRWTYLDHAAVAPLPAVAADAMRDWVDDTALNGATDWSHWRNRVERLRRSAAGLLGADERQIAVIRNTTEGVGLVAEGIGSHFDKGYIYFAMAFALAVESLNLWAGSRSRQKVAS